MDRRCICLEEGMIKEGEYFFGRLFHCCSLGLGGVGWVYGASGRPGAGVGCNIYVGSRTPGPWFSFCIALVSGKARPEEVVEMDGVFAPCLEDLLGGREIKIMIV
jgi:hypothetical protein